MKYNKGPERMIRTRKEISLFMAGQRVAANTDVCVIDRDAVILLVQEDKVKFYQPALSNFLMTSQRQYPIVLWGKQNNFLMSIQYCRLKQEKRAQISLC